MITTRISRLLLALTAAIGLSVVALSAATTASPTNYVAHLSAGGEVPANDSLSVGELTLQLSADRTELRYRLVVAGLVDVTQAHIHLGPVGVNGPVVAFLYPEGPPATLIPGRTDGVLLTGSITDSDLRGPLAGMPLSTLITAIESGNTYANAHTVVLPGGEIRGQIG